MLKGSRSRIVTKVVFAVISALCLISQGTSQSPAVAQAPPANAPGQAGGPQSGAPSQSPSSPAAPPKPAPSSGTILKKTVAFLTTYYRDGGEVKSINGTAFFVNYEDKRLGENRGFPYLVTNRHMADPQVIAPGASVVGYTLRANLKQATNGRFSEEAPIPIGGDRHWYFPADDAVDLAVIPLALNQDLFDYAPLPVSMFATRDVVQKYRIAEGDSVLFAGFFYQLPGQLKIEPIIRQGVLAMMPDEKLTTTLEKPGNIYLADVHVFGGNSGSPLFVNIGGYRNGTLSAGGFPYLLLGVVSGYFYEAQDFTFQVATTFSGKSNANSGISIVVPVDDLKDLLDSPDLASKREAAIAAMKK